MCVPVRFKFSRKKSTSRVRGSTTASRGSPVTRMRTVNFSTAYMFSTSLPPFSASTPYLAPNSTLNQSRDQRALVLRRTAHIALRFSRFPRRLSRPLNRLAVDLFPSQLTLRSPGANRCQSDATQNNTNLFANVLAVERELHRGARGGIYRRAAFEGQVRPATVPRRSFHDHFAHQLIVSENGCVRVLNEVFQFDGSLALRPDALHRSFQRKKRRAPVPARVRFRERTANRSLITYLHIRNARRAIVQDGNCDNVLGHFNIRVPRQRSKSKLSIVILDFGQAGNEIDVDQRRCTRQTHLH